MSPTVWRSVSRVRRSRRETCIWEIPSWAAISDWVRPSSKRRCEDPALALVEPLQPGAEHDAGVGTGEPRLLDRHVQPPLSALVVVGGQERGRAGVLGLQRVEHLLLTHRQLAGDVRDRRSSALLGRHPVDRGVHPHAQLLQRARHVHGPRAVAVVPLDLADDRRRGVRRELDVARGVEAVDRLQKADPGHLHEVVERLAAVGVARRQRPHQPAVALDQGVARVGVAVALPAFDQHSVRRHSSPRYGVASRGIGPALTRPGVRVSPSSPSVRRTGREAAPPPRPRRRRGSWPRPGWPRAPPSGRPPPAVSAVGARSAALRFCSISASTCSRYSSW